MKTSKVLVVALMIVVSGCYPGITGRVVDSDTQQSIQGAIVLAQWTKTHGIGLTYHSVYKTEETETDNNGEFSLSGVYSPFVDAPDLVIVKKGYSTWRNDYIFPDYKKRTDYNIWQSNYVYKLGKFKSEYSISDHSMFMDHSIMGSDSIPKFRNAVRDESIRAQPELDRQRIERNEQAFIECLRSMRVGKYLFHEFCYSLSQQTIHVERQRLINKANDKSSNIFKAMKDYGITIETVKSLPYFIKTQ